MWGMLKDRRFWAVLAVMALASVTVRLTAMELPALAPLSGLLQEALSPLQKAVFRLTAAVEGAGSSVAELWHLRQENARLEREVQRLHLLESRLEELRMENRRLTELLEFKNRQADLAGADMVAARVTGRNPDDWFRYIVIDKGAGDGIARDMVVITPRGLVGRVSRVTRHSATVMLLTDPQSGAGGMVQRETSRQKGVVLGEESRGDRLRIKFFQPKADVRAGDRIVTSELSRIYPPGLPIGEVASVTDSEDGLVRYAWIKPFVDFDRLEEVLVLPGKPDSSELTSPEK